MKRNIFNILVLCLLFSPVFSVDKMVKGKTDEKVGFDSVFKYEKTINLAQDKVIIARLRVLSIAADGNFWILDSRTQKIHKFKPDGTYISSQGGRGQGPSEYIGPTDMYLGKERMYVLDPEAKKINIHDLNGAFKTFYPLEDDGRTIQEIQNGKLLIGASTLNEKNSGNCLHIYSMDGKREKSFFPIHQRSIAYTLISDAVFFDQDKEGNIYALQEVDYKIHKFSPGGRLIQAFSTLGSHYVNPPASGPKNKFLREETIKWINSWTHIYDIKYNKGLLVVTLSHPRGSIDGFAYDIYSTDGKLKIGGLYFPHRLQMIDKQGFFYFLKQIDDADNNSYFSLLKYSMKDIKP